jgi:hypothetical protein
MPRSGPTRLLGRYHHQTAPARPTRGELPSPRQYGTAGTPGWRGLSANGSLAVRGWITNTPAASSRSITHRLTMPADQRGIRPVCGPRAHGSGGGTPSVF